MRPMTSTRSRTIPLASERRRLTVEFLWLVSSTAAFQASRIATGLVAAGNLPPAQFAGWGIALAILAYSVYFNFGIASGVNRVLPQSIGAGDARRAEQVQEAGLAGTLAASAFTLVAAAVIAGLASLDALVVGLLAASASAQQYYLHAQTTLRSRLRFNMASFQQTVLAVVFPVVALPMMSSLGVAALVLAQFVSFVVGAAFSDGWRIRWHPRIWSEVRTLIRIGFPIMLAGLMFAVLTTIDRWAVLVLLGEEATGLYTLAALLSSSALLVSVVLAQQSYPRMAYALGRGESRNYIFAMAVRQSAVATAIVAPASAVLALGAPPILEAMLPAYSASAPAIQILAIGFVLLVASSGFGNYLVVMGRPLVYVSALAGAAAVEVLLALALVELGVPGIAAAALIGYAALLVGTAALAAAVRRR